MNLSDTQINGQLAKWLTAVSGVPAWQSHQSAPRDANSYPFIVSTLLNLRELRSHEQRVDYAEDAASERVMATPVIETEWTYSVQAYGPGPTDILRPLRSAIKLAQVNEPLMPGLIFHDTSLIRFIPDFVNETTWEPRAQMDVMVRGLTEDGHLIDTIEHYSFEFIRR